MNVLIVDDEKDICELIKEYVLDIKVDTSIDLVGDGLEAFVSCTKKKYQLIITDLKMPFMNGNDLILALKSKKNLNIETPVVMLSGFLNKETAKKLEEKSIVCLNKPIDSKEFMDLLHSYLD